MSFDPSRHFQVDGDVFGRGVYFGRRSGGTPNVFSIAASVGNGNMRNNQVNMIE